MQSVNESTEATYVKKRNFEVHKMHFDYNPCSVVLSSCAPFHEIEGKKKKFILSLAQNLAL